MLVNNADKLVDSSGKPVEKVTDFENRSLSVLKFLKKKLQLDGTIKKMKEAISGAFKRSEKRKNKQIAVIKRKIASVRVKNHKNIKTSFIIDGSVFRVEIHKKNIDVYENRKPNEIFASRPRGESVEPGNTISKEDLEFISFYL